MRGATTSATERELRLGNCSASWKAATATDDRAEDDSGLETWVVVVVVLAGCVCLVGVGAAFYLLWWRKDDQQTVSFSKSLGAAGGLATTR